MVVSQRSRADDKIIYCDTQIIGLKNAYIPFVRAAQPIHCVSLSCLASANNENSAFSLNGQVSNKRYATFYTLSK